MSRSMMQVMSPSFAEALRFSRVFHLDAIARHHTLVTRLFFRLLSRHPDGVPGCVLPQGGGPAARGPAGGLDPAGLRHHLRARAGGPRDRQRGRCGAGVGPQPVPGRGAVRPLHRRAGAVRRLLVLQVMRRSRHTVLHAGASCNAGSMSCSCLVVAQNAQKRSGRE